MGKCEAVFQQIDKLYEAYLTIWEQLCKIESPTDCKEGVDAVGRYCMDIAKKHGWHVEILPQKISGDAICITMNSDAKAQPVSLSGHMDTVHPVGSFESPIVTTDEKSIYGPGVTDCKGGIVAALLAMDALHRTGFTARPVQLLLQSDEENSSVTSGKRTIQWICEKAKDAVAFLNLEPVLEGCEGHATVARKGIANYRFQITGIAAHSSRCATDGASAIREAAHKILELEKCKDADGVTCSCGVISGGTVVNAVPETCSFDVNFRFFTMAQYAQVEKLVKTVADTVYVPGCTCGVTQTSFRVPMEENERNYKLLDAMNGIFEKNGMPRLKPRKVNGGADSADVTMAGIPCVDSIGVVGGRIHSKEEYGVKVSLKDAAKKITAVISCI